MSIILPFVLLLLHSLPHHGGIEGNKKIRCTAYYHIILIQTLRIWNENPIFLVLSGWNQLELPKGTCRKIEGEIWFAACNVGRVISLRTGRGSKLEDPKAHRFYSKHFSSFFFGAGYPDVDPSPSSKTTVSNFCFSAGSPGWNPTMINMKMNLSITTLTTRQLQPINVLHWYTGIGVYFSDCQPCFSGMTILTHSYVWMCWNQQNEDPTMNPKAVALRCPRIGLQ